MNNLLHDIRYALRTLRKSPAFVLVAVVALALGIGANSTIFITVNAMLLRPIAVRDLDRVVAVWGTLPSQHARRLSASPADFRDWGEQNEVFERIAAGHGWDANLTGSGLPERLEGYQVTGTFFPLLGVEPMLGRTINADDQQPGKDRVVVLSYTAWKNRFASDAAIIGKTIMLNGQEMSVIGVMGPDFDYPLNTGIWGPLSLTPSQLADRNDHYLTVIGRLKSGVAVRAAQAQMDAVAARLGRAFPDTNNGHGVRIVTLVNELNDATRDFLLLLTAAAGFVLLLACANVANLQLARATGRIKEFALRTALGASRFRLVRQLLVESQIVALAGACLGLLLAVWGTDIILASVPPFIIAHIAGLKHLKVDATVVGFTATIAVLTGLLSGTLPAFHASAMIDLQDTLKEGGRTTSSGSVRHRLRSVLVVSEVTLALVLLIGSGLLVKGFRALTRIDQGFDPANVLTFRLTLPEAHYPQPPQRAALYQSVLQKLHAINGVEAASPLSSVPSGWSWNGAVLVIEGQAPPTPGEMRSTITQTAGPELLETMRIPLVRGRAFLPSDGPDTQPVALVSAGLAQRYWPNADVIGKRIRLGEEEKEPWRTVVGVVGGVRTSSFDLPQGTTYTPFAQVPPQATSFVVRTKGNPLAIAAAVRQQVASVDAGLPVYDLRAQEQVIGDNISGIQFSARMMTAFGLLSLLLAGAGIYAVMSYSVAQRTHEIGVRMALGARTSDVLRMIVGHTLRLAGIGLGLGLPLAFIMSRLLAGVMFGVIRGDAVVFVVFPLMLGAVALLAGYVPARWASRVDPMIALRAE
jgi:putative ABC transport system permease protein